MDRSGKRVSLQFDEEPESRMLRMVEATDVMFGSTATAE